MVLIMAHNVRTLQSGHFPSSTTSLLRLCSNKVLFAEIRWLDLGRQLFACPQQLTVKALKTGYMSEFGVIS